MIFKISSPTDCQGNSLCNCDGDFHLTWTTLQHYLSHLKIQNNFTLTGF